MKVKSSEGIIVAELIETTLFLKDADTLVLAIEKDGFGYVRNVTMEVKRHGNDV